jgi:hypothetical protein
VCTGAKGQIKGVDCKVGKAKPLCKNNVVPTPKTGGAPITCRTLPNCNDAPGLAVGTECYEAGKMSSLLQME